MSDELVPAGPCTKDEAERLTAQIRFGANGLWALMQDAHNRRAWAALGYSTWDAYVRAEFEMSRQNAYRLLAQAEVIEAIEAASPSDTRALHATPIVSARQAGVVKSTPGALSGIKKAVKAGVDPKTAVKKAVAKARPTRKRKPKPDRQGELQAQLRADVDGLVATVGLKVTADLLAMHAKRVDTWTQDRRPPPAAKPRACAHPKESEDPKPYGVWCGLCRKKIR